MTHKKREHTTEACKDFLTNTCSRGEGGEKCWFSHNLNNVINNIVPNLGSQLDFPNPPTSSQQTLLVGSLNTPQNQDQMKNQMMMNMMTMMNHFMNMNMKQ